MKIIRSLVVICLFYPCFCTGQERDYIFGVFENYFPFNPFETTFSDFFKKLNSDPFLLNKSLHKRTDTSLFSFSGTYYNYDRGITDKANVEIKLNEISLQLGDTLAKKDTFFLYQVIYNYDLSSTSPGYVKKLFTRFGEQYHGVISDIADYDVKENNKVIGLTRNYFYNFSPVSQMTAAWANLNDHESIFTILVRFKLIQNELVLYFPEPEKSP
jgi:hypothetical protein